MRSFAVELGAWSYEPQRDHAILTALVEAFAFINRTGLEVDSVLRGGSVPLLYKSGVRYKADEPRRQVMRDYLSCLDAGAADCKSLCAWRAAEYALMGEPCVVEVVWGLRDKSGLLTYHVRLKTRHGVEDPSRALGMP